MRRGHERGLAGVFFCTREKKASLPRRSGAVLDAGAKTVAWRLQYSKTGPAARGTAQLWGYVCVCAQRRAQSRARSMPWQRSSHACLS